MKKSIAFRFATLVAATAVSLYAFAQLNAKQSTPSHQQPSIVLLHDSSEADIDWANAASKLTSKFEITLVDISNYLNNSEGVKLLREKLDELHIDDIRISGSKHGEKLAQSFSKSYPENARSFILPHNSEDMETLAHIFNTTLCKNS